MKIKKQHRLLSLFFSLALVISALGAGVPTSAENKVDNILTSVTEECPNRWWLDKYFKNRNLLKDQFSNITFWHENALKYEYGSADQTWFNSKSDGEEGSLTAPNNNAFKDEDNSIDQSDCYWKLDFKINGVINNPEKFIFSFHKSSTTLASHHYAVFVAENYEDIENNKIIEITSENDRNADVVDVSTLSLKNIKFVEVRIYHRGMNNWTWGSMTQHINELGFFGGTVETDNSVITEHKVYSALSEVKNTLDTFGTNRLAEQAYEPSKFYIDNTPQGNEQIKDWIKSFFSKDIKTNADSDAICRWHDAATVDSCPTKTMQNDMFQTSAYREMIIDLNAPISNPEKFVFSFNYDGRASKHYAVYMSDTRESLYDDANKVAEVYDASRDRKGDLIDLSGLKNNVVSYVGIRIYNFANASSIGCKAQYISHIGLYGGMIAGDVNGNETVDNEDITALRTYLLTSTAETGYVYDVNGDKKENICDLVYVNSFIK